MADKTLALGIGRKLRVLKIAESGGMYYLYQDGKLLTTWESYEETLRDLKRMGTLRWEKETT